MPKFRKKPVVIEAIQVVENSVPFPFIDAGAKYRGLNKTPNTYPVQIKTLEGWLDVKYGDWIVNGVAGEFYPVKPEIFEVTYEAVSSD